MRGAILATAAALMGTAMADGALHRRHDALHQRRWASSSAIASSATPLAEQTCGCTTKVITYWGSPTMVPVSSTEAPAPVSTVSPTTSVQTTVSSTTTVQSTQYSTSTVTYSPTSSATPSPTPTPTPTPTPAPTLPTPGMSSFSATGTYTMPATTVVVTDTTTVCGATTTAVPSGTHTIGQTVTVVTTATTITCPYATQSPSGTTVTDIVTMTTYTCPVAGTYTVVPGTVTTVPAATTLTYPAPHTITPGTYTQPESTVTVTDTDTTYYCPFATSGAPTSTPTQPAAAPAVPTTTAAPAPASTTTTTNSVPSGAAAWATPGTGGVTGSNLYGMTYDPYTSSGACKSMANVMQDISDIHDKGFRSVRIYSTDCNSLQYIGDAVKKYGMQMILGVFIDQTGVSGAQMQVSEIAAWAQWPLVDFIVIGNEAIESGYVTAAELAGFIVEAITLFQAAGWTGRTTTSETINIWQAYGASTLCNAVDLVGANIHPFYNSATTAAQAGEFAASEIAILENICGGKDVLNLETGWPTGGYPNGLAVPSPQDQVTAIQQLVQHVGSKSVFFSFANELWKAPGAFSVEQHWGCAQVF